METSVRPTREVGTGLGCPHFPRGSHTHVGEREVYLGEDRGGVPGEGLSEETLRVTFVVTLITGPEHAHTTRGRARDLKGERPTCAEAKGTAQPTSRHEGEELASFQSGRTPSDTPHRDAPTST